MTYNYLSSLHDVISHIERLNDNSPYTVLDVETDSLNTREANIIDIQLSGLTPNTAVMFPGKFKHVLTKIKIPLVLHNYKYDYAVLYHNGIDLLNHPVRDTMLLHHLYDENKFHSLDNIITDFYGADIAYKKDFWKKYKNYSEATLEDRLEYACKDIIFTDLIYKDLCDKLGIDVRFS